jgi:hypothetical protein
MGKKKIRKKRGGSRHFSRQRKRIRFLTSLGVKGKDVVLVDATLTQQRRYMAEGEIYCCRRKQFFSIDDCLALQDKGGSCKNVSCPNKIK